MTLLFFSSVRDGPAQSIQGMIKRVLSVESFEVCRSIRALSQRLHQPRGDLRVAVVNISSQKELTAIVSLKNLLDDIETILILPDATKETVSKAHLLRPRFLAPADADPVVIAAVVAKMLRRCSGKSIQ